MRTQIFENYEAFLKRENKDINGCTREFAETKKINLSWDSGNKGCWNCLLCSDCSECWNCSGCSECWNCSGCSGCSHCSHCSRCSNCAYCSDCSECWNCSNCSDCLNCSGEKAITGTFEVPLIPNIHQAVLQTVSRPNALEMTAWHTCETTHCRAGWVVNLAGEAGKKLEEQTSTLFAAMQIYKKSSPNIKVSPIRFFETNEIAMKDIQRCAELEKELTIERS